MRFAKDAPETHKRLFNKDSRTVRDLTDDRDARSGALSFGGDTLEMFWGWNEAVETDRIFKLRIPVKCEHCDEKQYKTVLIDADDLQRHLRWV